MGRRIVFFACLATCACGKPNDWLEGSISRNFSLDFDKVAISRLGCVVRIDYIKDWPVGSTTPCRVEVDSGKAPLAPGATTDGHLFLDAVTVSRIALMGGDFPQVLTGQIHFVTVELSPGHAVTGSFKATFDDADEHDISGTYDEPLTDPEPTVDCR